MTDFDKYLEEAVTKDLPSSEDEADIKDEDTCSVQELAANFRLQYKPQDESVVSLKRDYVLSLGADHRFTRIAAGLSSTAVHIYDLETAGGLKTVQDVPAKEKTEMGATICGVQFLDEGSDALLVGTTDGMVRLFDLRTSGEQARFEYKSEPEAQFPQVPKSLTCFDRNANSRIICCGTEQYIGSVHLLFFDVRERKQLGGFYESHQDDVTSVRFHDRNPDMLCTGGTDGLINLFDIKQTDEDEALQNTINTESSVHRLNWHRNVYDKDIISCITHTNDFKSYECEEGDEVASFERSGITEAIRRKNAGNFNLINAHNLEDNGVFLLAGTNYNRGEILRSVSVLSKEKLEPLANFAGNKQIVRDSLFDAKRQLLVTGGESGIVSVWTQDATGNASNSGKLKTKIKSHKKTPY
ncbi:WD repeat-containing protein 89 [Drosophila pseudoobscura]|uniref:WD repeat-containing protein 89 n=1 Tax=Drosophila pseudoobscura pseudoobscura TaxID=46245 RepID=A0A6I8UVE8_DROPS|nr:WD repeat-containing protein 89 [Drosophila pseudoobscura]